MAHAMPRIVEWPPYAFANKGRDADRGARRVLSAEHATPTRKEAAAAQEMCAGEVQASGKQPQQ
jgi:hypothetical protein